MPEIITPWPPDGICATFPPAQERATVALSTRNSETFMAKKKTVKKAPAPKSGTPAVKALKEPLSKGNLVRHLSEQAQVGAKEVKAVLAALENTVLGSVHKKGAGQFVLPGLLKITSQAVPAKAKRFAKDPFTGLERWFDAKPATVRVKVRALKKLKEAAL